jgi:hypothetical protein
LHALDAGLTLGAPLCARFCGAAQSAQLLACGTSDGQVLLYDLLLLGVGVGDAAAAPLVHHEASQEPAALLALRFNTKE